jgi:hypothetical protein
MDALATLIATTVAQTLPTPIGEALSVASFADKAGVVGILVLACIWLGYLYLCERKENRQMQREVVANSREMTQAIMGFQATVNSFKDTMNSILPYLRSAPKE